MTIQLYPQCKGNEHEYQLEESGAVCAASD